MPNDPLSLASIRGLSEAVVQARLKTEGYNELPRADRRTPLRIILEVVREPMLALLLGGGVIYLALGDVTEALILLAFATMSVSITIVQETRTERVLEALRDLTSPRALVIRDGERKRIAGREVVRGDLVVFAEGDRVPADVVLVQSHDLQTDESLLTGESVPVRKIASSNVAPSRARRPGGDDGQSAAQRAGPICVFRFVGCARVRNRRGDRDRRTKRNRQDRPVAQHPGPGAATAAGTDPPACAGVRHGRRGGERSRGASLWHLARRMARCRARWHSARHVNAARRVPGRAHRIHGDGCLAHLAGACVDPARCSHRDPRLCNGLVHG